MNHMLEENRRLYDVLSALKEGYTTGNFNNLFPFLAQDCVMESQWVFSANVGYEVVTSYLSEKGKTLAKNDAFPKCSFVELVGNCNPVKNASVTINGEEPKTASIGLMYTPGKLCLKMEQTIDDKINEAIVDVTLNESGQVKRIDLCIPELFNYRYFFRFVDFYPGTDVWNEEDEEENYVNIEHKIPIEEHYWECLHLFMACAGQNFDEARNLHIPMEKWINTLMYWKIFLSAENFDEAFEKIAGVDYDADTIQNKQAAETLGKSGKWAWENREKSRNILERLLEWTALYKDEYSYINTFSW